MDKVLVISLALLGYANCANFNRYTSSFKRSLPDPFYGAPNFETIHRPIAHPRIETGFTPIIKHQTSSDREFRPIVGKSHGYGESYSQNYNTESNYVNHNQNIETLNHDVEPAYPLNYNNVESSYPLNHGHNLGASYPFKHNSFSSYGLRPVFGELPNLNHNLGPALGLEHNLGSVHGLNHNLGPVIGLNHNLGQVISLEHNLGPVHGLNQNLGSVHGLNHNLVSHSKHTVSTIDKHVPITVPQPIPVTINKAIPVHIHVPVPIDVPRPVHVPVPQPVHIDVPRPVHYEVPRPVPVPVKQPYPVQITQNVAIPYPQHIPVNIPQPVFVPQPIPVQVHHQHHQLPVHSIQQIQHADLQHGSDISLNAGNVAISHSESLH